MHSACLDTVVDTTSWHNATAWLDSAWLDLTGLDWTWLFLPLSWLDLTWLDFSCHCLDLSDGVGTPHTYMPSACWFVFVPSRSRNRASDKSGEAVELLTRALHLSDKLDDLDSKASTLCNLGSALMQVCVFVCVCVHVNMWRYLRFPLADILAQRPCKFTFHKRVKRTVGSTWM